MVRRWASLDRTFETSKVGRLSMRIGSCSLGSYALASLDKARTRPKCLKSSTVIKANFAKMHMGV